MKICFFAIVFLFTLLMAGYVTLRGWQAIQSVGSLRYWYLAGNIVLFISMLIGILATTSLPQPLAKALSFAGFSYMVLMIYLFFPFILVDIIRIANAGFHFAPEGMQTFRLWAFVVSFGVIMIAMISGNYKFNHPETVYLHLKSNKPEQEKTLKIVAASDIHLGVSIDKKRLKEYVAMINAQKPDIVLLAGDISDRPVEPLIDQKMAEELSSIHAPLGVYAISGNHEYYSGNPRATEDYLKTAGIIYLRDSVALIDNAFYVAGRDDKTNHKRKSLTDLLKSTDKSKPVIVLDHQPFKLSEARENNADLQISGHTHNGQFFPGNLFVKSMYEVGYGYKKIGNTHYYVSSGLGLWGPQYRIGSQSELVVIDFSY
jgi:predicted MPP superfamily phosphohydrolase